jgi:hypothetical protein
MRVLADPAVRVTLTERGEANPASLLSVILLSRIEGALHSVWPRRAGSARAEYRRFGLGVYPGRGSRLSGFVQSSTILMTIGTRGRRAHRRCKLL